MPGNGDRPGVREEPRAGPAPGFVLFSPDATTTGRHRRALGHLRLHGLVSTALRWTRVGEETVERLYAANRQAPGTDHASALVDELFALDYSLAAEVRAAGDGEMDVPGLLKRIKGASDPDRGRPGELRVVLGAESKILNFVHASDTPEEAVREGSLFFDGFGAVPGGAAPLPPPPPDLGRRVSVSPWHVRSQLKRELCAWAGSAALARFGLLAAEEERLARLRRKTPAVLASLARIQRLQVEVARRLPLGSAERDAFEALLDVRWADADAEGLLSTLQDAGLAATRWDALILRADWLQRAAPGRPAFAAGSPS